MKRCSLAFVVLLLCACTTAPGEQLSCGNADPNTYYFPAGIFAEADHPDRLPSAGDDDYDPEFEQRAHYSEILDFLSAPSLFCGSPSTDETYRLVWVRSFHVAVVIQVSRNANTYSIDLLMADEKREDGKPIIHRQRTLSSAEWRRITTGLRQIDFWNLVPNNELTGLFRIPGSTDILVRTSGKDGAHWVIEGRSDRYHVIDRWSEDYDVIAVGRIFLDLARLQIPEDDIY